MPEFFKQEIRKLWMPLQKVSDGEYRAILSDTSIDRDDEMMSKKLLQSWAKNKTIPALVNHKNEMDSWVGGWNGMEVVSKGEHSALSAKYKLFSKRANPKAQQIKKQIEEAIEMGMQPGISIGAIPKDYDEIEIDGKEYKRWKSAELVEASFVPVQSNRGSYAFLAKSFKLEKLAKLDSCVKQLMADPKFKPKGGKSKEESAYAVCQESIKSGITPEEVINKMPHEEDEEEKDKKKPKKDEKKGLMSSIKKDYLQKFYPTKKAVREVFEKMFKDNIEDIGKEWRIKCNKYVLEKLRKEIIVKKGEEYPMPNQIKHKKKNDLEDVVPSMTNFAKASQGMELDKTPKSGDK